MSAHFNVPDKINEDRDAFLSALRSFNQISPGLGEGANSTQNDLRQLRDALHNFKIGDRGDFSELNDGGCRKDSLATTFTGETSGSEPDLVPTDALLSEALTNARVTSNGSLTTSRNPHVSLFPRVHLTEENLRDDGSETTSLIEDLPAISEMSPAVMAKHLFHNDNRVLPHNEIAEYLGKR